MLPEIQSFLLLLVLHSSIVRCVLLLREDLLHGLRVGELFVHAYCVLRNLLYAREMSKARGWGGLYLEECILCCMRKLIRMKIEKRALRGRKSVALVHSWEWSELVGSTGSIPLEIQRLLSLRVCLRDLGWREG